jgi:hypothetical protein
VLLALGAALLLAAWPLRKGLVERDTILFGVDTATSQKPWAGLFDTAVQNPELSDQGVVFYPAYVHVSRRWRAGEVPLWNPLLYAGAPLLANPQLGVLDPQVLALVALESLGGRGLFDRGFAFLAWLRLAAAGLGAYLLARELGLRKSGAALAAITFGGSGFLIVWLNHSLGHVAPLLPWVLLGAERSRSWRGVAGTATALALAILGGHPETAFYVGACAGIWSLAILRRDREHGLRALAGLALGTLLAAASLVPFAEYLAHSGALLARRLIERPTLDLVALGALLIATGIALAFRASLASESAAPGGRAWLRAVGVGGLLLAAALLLSWSPSAALVLAPDLLGSPLHHPEVALSAANAIEASRSLEPWRGEGSYLEAACSWIAAVPLVLALAAILSPAPASGALRRRGVAAWLGVIALLLAIRTPGLSELHALLPLVGHGAIARLAVVSALLLGLLAGEALDSAPRPARFASVALIGLFAALWPRGGSDLAPRPEDAIADPPDGLVGLVEGPPPVVTSGTLTFAGWLHRDLPDAQLSTKLARWNGSEWVAFDHIVPTYSSPLAEQDAAQIEEAPQGARAWKAYDVDVRYLMNGTWRMSLELRNEEGGLLGSRDLAFTQVVRPRRWPPLSLALLAASLGLCAFAPLRPSRAFVALFLGLPLLQSVRLAEGFHPTVPSKPTPLAGAFASPTSTLPALKFRATRTEAWLGSELGALRFLSDPGILPPSTGMVSGVRSADGYDALDPASFDAYRAFALKPGVHPLLGFTASGADLDAPAFRLLGVGALLASHALEHPGWKVAASPGSAAGSTEVYVHAPLDPPPRAFVVGRARKLSEVAATPQALAAAGFEPFEEVLLDDPAVWQPSAPLRSWSVDSIEWADERVAVRATLDGDGLLVLTDQHFPGWRVEVDGEPREILVADAIFRGVPLGSGTHEVVFTYRPLSARFGAWISALALLATCACALTGRASTRA